MAITPLSATIDLNPSYKVNTVVYVSQLDNNLRQIAFTIQDGGVNYDVAASGYDVYIEGTKPDNRGFSYKVTDIGGTVSGSVVTVPIQTQMTAVQGLVSTEIVLKSGANRIGSANFILMVERAGLADDIDVSETDIPGYINGAQQAAAAAAQSAEDAEDAKDTAVNAATTAQNVLDSIPEDYSQMSEDLGDLKSAFEEFPTGIYPDMAVGSLMSEEYTEEKMPYLYRVSGGGSEVGKVEADTIVGGSVAWNQKIGTGSSYFANNRSTAVWNGTKVVWTSTESGLFGGYTLQSKHATVAGHKYYATALVNISDAGQVKLGFNDTPAQAITPNTNVVMGKIIPSVANNEAFVLYRYGNTDTTGQTLIADNIMLIDLTQMFGSAVADYLYSLETATEGSGVSLFRKLFPNAYYPYNAGELMHVSGVSEHKTVGKNLLPSISASETKNGVTATLRPDGSIWFHGQASANAMWDLARNVLILPSGTYYSNLTANNVTVTVFKIVDGTATAIKNGGRLFTLTEETSVFLRLSVSNGTSVNTVVYPQIEIGSTATTYEPYEKHTYPLDSSLTLRGVPKLDSANNLYYDGDTYEADGTVTRKYGIVDLGTLNWQLSSSTASGFYASMLRYAEGMNVGMICAKYPFAGATTSNYYEEGLLKCYTGSSNPAREIYIKDSKYSDAATFKTAMNGVYLVYELATPTEETAEPYEEYQHVTNGGTEEYVSTSIVPVGHNTKYYGDIGSKVDKLPSDFSNIIAPTESAFKATRAYTVNDLIIIDNVLYKVTASIASGATITPNTNVQQTTLSALIKALSA